eukprot:9480965-Pyramimonas_sp.AAC.1
MFLEPRTVLITKAVFSERKPDVFKQDRFCQKCSKSIPRRTQEVLRTLFGRPIGTPRRLATAHGVVAAPLGGQSRIF